ncbi:MAG: serine/threonine protein kinase [Deltaproteobacteria bacterium]|nr:serine/threonine protein kinase [Deltaproteobacteria bacterium]
MTIARNRIERLIGGGAMGRVFVCRTPEDRVVAVKLLRSSHAAMGDRLLDKRGALEKVRSPHVVEVYDVSVYNNVPFVVMELAEGGTLADLLKQGPLRTVDALGYAGEIAEGARAAWAQGVAHGDLRPHNVLLVQDHVKLVDFLLAPAVEGTTSVRGTPAYVAPELLVGTPPDALSDIYAFGSMLAECLTGRTPYQGSPGAVLQQQSADRPISFAAMMPGAPHFLVELVDRLLEKDRARRMKTWDEVIEGVERAKRGLSMKEVKPQLPDVELDIDTSFDDEHKTAEVHTSASAKDLMDSIDDEEPIIPAAAPAAPAAAASPWVHRAAAKPEQAPPSVLAPAPMPMSLEELELPELPPPAALDEAVAFDVDEAIDDQVLEDEATRVQPGITSAADALGDLLGDRSGAGQAKPKPKKP